ncbi:MAG: preprotein translocase subunit SecG [Chitinophagales bacterium]|jgi:preprotein translocase subunit SecG
MLSLLSILITIVSLLLMLVILIQNPKGGGVDPTLGGQAQQLFGAARSTDVVEKATWVLAGALILLCIAAVFVVGTGSAAELVPLQSE